LDNSSKNRRLHFLLDDLASNEKKVSIAIKKYNHFLFLSPTSAQKRAVSEPLDNFSKRRRLYFLLNDLALNKKEAFIMDKEYKWINLHDYRV
jgi:hypothetical protein